MEFGIVLGSVGIFWRRGFRGGLWMSQECLTCSSQATPEKVWWCDAFGSPDRRPCCCYHYSSSFYYYILYYYYYFHFFCDDEYTAALKFSVRVNHCYGDVACQHTVAATSWLPGACRRVHLRHGACHETAGRTTLLIALW